MPNTNDHLTICINNCASPNKLRNDKARGGSFGDGASGLSFFGGFSVMVGSVCLVRRRPDADAMHASAITQRLIFCSLGLPAGLLDHLVLLLVAQIAGDRAAAANEE